MVEAKMSHLQLQLHSSPSLLSSSSSSSSSSSYSSSFSSHKLCPNHSFSPKSFPFKPLTLTQPIRCRNSDLFDNRLLASPPQRPAKPNASVGALPPRVYVDHSIYKGKAALTVTPRPPEFAPSGPGAFKISGEGFVLLQFAPAVGTRQYDWNRKQLFSLSVDEMGRVISLGARESCEFFHDTFKGKSDEGKVRKILKLEPFPDGSGHFFNLSVQNKIVNVDENITVPVTKAESAVLNSIFKFIMPYLLGWHIFANSINPENSSVANNATPRYGGDYEWNR